MMAEFQQQQRKETEKIALHFCTSQEKYGSMLFFHPKSDSRHFFVLYRPFNVLNLNLKGCIVSLKDCSRNVQIYGYYQATMSDIGRNTKAIKVNIN